MNNPARNVPHAVYASRKVPFTHVRELGRGAFAIVDEVQTPNWTPELGHNFEGKTFARKALKVSRRQPKEAILAEIEIAVKLRHYHLVEVIMTYEETPGNPWETPTFGMIMNPVAHITFQVLLDGMEMSKYIAHEPRADLEKWFGCLASGLAFLHLHRIRHKDIKPANILLRGRCILYSDFGVSRFVAPEVTDTQTEGPPGRLTYKYAAPEVIAHDLRGRKADVFSLGCIFAEMTTFLSEGKRAHFETFRGPPGQRAFHESLDETLKWLFLLQPRAAGYHRYCCAAMIPDPDKRISSRDLEKWIICDRDNRAGWKRNRACECLGTEPAGTFQTVSLGEGSCMPPYGDKIGEGNDISWQRALDHWIGVCEWSQDTPQTIPRLLSITPPTLAGHFPVNAEAFFTTI
ncbi:putative serine/threonine-protein kinase receptor [Diplodia seriata]|uniref:Putative serine/threonine-protein kinase receptor n=1 Tax=Diplodia seriata TaxID=420778 RepID=A0A1S8BA04_9PEZI|nr:putative serine/threonine-protein kinase receptor [Diplodia seriata]